MKTHDREEFLFEGVREEFRTTRGKSLEEIEEGIGRVVRMHKHLRSSRSRGFGSFRGRP